MEIKDNIRVIIKNNGIKYSVRNNRNRVFYPDEWNRFYNSLKEDKKPLFYTLLSTGARINEVLNIKKRDIDLINGTVNLRVIKKRTNFSDGGQRTIPLSTEYLKFLNKYIKYLDEEDLLFRITKPGVSQMFKRTLGKASLPEEEFSLHNIRKTLETWLCSLNIGLPIILKHFGHNQSTALNHYIQMDLFNIQDKIKMRIIIGDLYSNQIGEFLERRFLNMEKTLLKYSKRIKFLEERCL